MHYIFATNYGENIFGNPRFALSFCSLRDNRFTGAWFSITEWTTDTKASNLASKLNSVNLSILCKNFLTDLSISLQSASALKLDLSRKVKNDCFRDLVG